MAELELEGMLLGVWKNIEEMEESISLPELEALVKVGREREERQNRFLAALKGIRLDEEEGNTFEDVKRRAEARLTGKSSEQMEFSELGIDIEVIG